MNSPKRETMAMGGDGVHGDGTTVMAADSGEANGIKPASPGDEGAQAPVPIPSEPRNDEFLPGLVNCKRETDSSVQALADKLGVGLAAFIAPYVGVKVSPTQHVSASIGLIEEFGAEELVSQLKRAGVSKAYLLINSPGGGMESSYKIARAVTNAIGDIKTFVPHMAASGGTLLALTGNEIVMGSMSQLSPLDVQVTYERTAVSAGSGQRFFHRAARWFKTQTPEEAPYPQRALVDRMDPYIMEEWTGIMAAMHDYVVEILELSGYGEQSKDIATRLVFEYPHHSYVINDNRARDIGLKVRDASELPEEWSVMRHWLSNYAVQQEATHVIRFAVPKALEASKTHAAGRNDEATSTTTRRTSKRGRQRNTIGR
jgi:hypothetical protein